MRRLVGVILLTVAVGFVTATTAAASEQQQKPDVELLEKLLERVEQLDFDDASAVYELAEWARRKEMPTYARELYRRALDADPWHESAHEGLRRTSGEAPAEDAERRRDLAEQFPGFNLHETEHFLIVHDVDDASVERRARMLERTRDVFRRAFRQADIPTRPLPERLVVILFADEADFDAYARTTDNVHRQWSLGHYSPRTNRIAFHHEPGGSAIDRYNRRVEAAKAEVRELSEAIRRARRARDADRVDELKREQREAQAELARLRSRRTRLADATDTARTTHEAAHQLAFNTGILRRGVSYPLWLLEGMATNFEAPRPAGGFGPTADNAYRRAALIEADRADALLQLEELIEQVTPPEDGRRVRELYAQSWALFRFLFRRHPEELRDYLGTLYTLERGEADPNALRQAFVDAFGEPDEVQQRFNRYVRSLR